MIQKRGGFTDLFLFMIIAFIVVLISVVFIYIGKTTTDQLHLTMDGMNLSDGNGNNASVVIDQHMGAVTGSYQALTWITVFLIVGMMLSIFIGSYLVTTKPIFFVPYFFITIIAIVVSVPISNTYETLMNNATLSSTFSQFTGANWLMLHLPVWVTIIGFVGAIIIFSRMGKGEERGGYY